MINLKGNYPEYKWILLITLLGDTYAISFYYLAKRYTKLAIMFASITTLVLTIVSIEIEMLTAVLRQDGGSCAAIIALIGALS